MTHICPDCGAILTADERECPICGKGKAAAAAAASLQSSEALHAAAEHAVADGVLVEPMGRSALRTLLTTTSILAVLGVCGAMVFATYMDASHRPGGSSERVAGYHSVALDSSNSAAIPAAFIARRGSTGTHAGTVITSRSSVVSLPQAGGSTARNASAQASTQTLSQLSVPAATGGGATSGALVPPAYTPSFPSTQTAAPQNPEHAAQLAALDQQLSDGRTQLARLQDVKNQATERLQQLQAAAPPDGAPRQAYDQQVQVLQTASEQSQAAIDAAQAAIDALQAQRDRVAGQ